MSELWFSGWTGVGSGGVHGNIQCLDCSTGWIDIHVAKIHQVIYLTIVHLILCEVQIRIMLTKNEHFFIS